MKPIILLLLLLPFISVKAQNQQTESRLLKFISTEGHMEAFKDGKSLGMKIMPDEMGKDVLIVFDIDQHHINFFSSKPAKLTTYGPIIKKAEADKSIDNFVFTCIDNDGTECKVEQMKFANNPGAFVVVLEYDSIRLIYKCKFQP